MFDFIFDPNAWATLALLVGLELVLGIDNILIISILTDRLPAEKRELGRKIGLAAALFGRLLALAGVSYIQKLTNPWIFGLTGKDIILLSGGLFLLYKAVKEIHHVVEGSSEGAEAAKSLGKATVGSVVFQILMFDLVFSIDSIITAIGLTTDIVVIYIAVLFSFLAVLLFSKPVASFVLANPALKILALSFLIVIGVTLFLEGMHVEVPKGYIYMPMGFALGVELLQMRYSTNKKRKNPQV
jgi:predicted tellurium resistance membrane protein TerC